MEKEFKFCPQCGNKVEKSAKFCDACGYNFITKEERTNETAPQPSNISLKDKLNKRVLTAALVIGLVLVIGIYFSSNNFEIAGEYESLDAIDSGTTLEISKKGIATIIETSEYDESRYEVGLPLIYDDQTETYSIDVDKKIALSIAGPLADVGSDDMEQIDQFIKLLGLTKETEGENMVLSGEIDFALLEMANLGGDISSLVDEFIIVDKGNDLLDIAGESFIKINE